MLRVFGCGAWLSLVERLLWEQDVGGSNPLAPTTSGMILTRHFERRRKYINGAGKHLQAGKDSNAIRGKDPQVGARL